MFAAQHDNPASLRQGDIIADVFFPLTRPALLKYLATYNSGSDIDIRVEPFVEAPQGAKKRYVQAISHGVVAHGTVISQCYDLILGSKKHQLDDLNRNKFRVKVGALFGRPTEEDIADGLTNPYQPVAPRSRNLIDRVRGFFGRR
jgi:hypothetical protein